MAEMLNDFILVRPLGLDERTSPGGIIMPESKKEFALMGEIMAVGDGKVKVAWDHIAFGRVPVHPALKVGKRCYYQRVGKAIVIKGETFEYLREDDIIMVFD